MKELILTLMQNQTNSRQSLTLAIIGCYFLPVLLFSGYSIGLMSDQKSWNILIAGLALIACGSILLIFLSRKYELTLDQQPSEAASQNISEPTIIQNNLPELQQEPNQLHEELKNSLEVSQGKQEELLHEIRKREDDLQRHINEKNHLVEKIEGLQQEALLFKQNVDGTVNKYEALRAEFEKAAQEQRDNIEKKQQKIVMLETTIHDLNYEMKTLLKLTQQASNDMTAATSNSFTSQTISPAPHSQAYLSSSFVQEQASSTAASESLVRTPHEAALQLTRAIDIAQKFTGASHFGSSSRFRDMSVNSYALDLRHLCDSLRSESGSMLILYSQKEDKLLFTNNQTKELLGWSPEKFIQDFPHLIPGSWLEWKQSIAQLATKNESQLRLLIKAKGGHEIMTQCHLGLIPTGIFRSHIIGVVYAAKT